MRHKKSKVLVVALYVDELLIAGTTKSDITDLKENLFEKFEMKYLGPANVMLGIEIRRDRTKRKIFISQSEYTE